MCSKMVTYIFSGFLVAIFVTIAMVIVNLIPDFLHMDYCSNKKEICEKQLSVLAS